MAVQHNVSEDNADPAGTARALLKTRPGLIALEELTPGTLPAYAAALAPEYPHHGVVGTVGLWSKYPLAGTRPVDIRPDGVGTDWNRGLRAEVWMPEGEPVAVYVAHLPSVRLGPTGFGTGWRDESAALLGAAVAAEPLDRVVLLGDLNSTVDDRGLDPVVRRMDTADRGFAFSWPARFPVARIDQIMTRKATVTQVWSLPATAATTCRSPPASGFSDTLEPHRLASLAQYRRHPPPVADGLHECQPPPAVVQRPGTSRLRKPRARVRHLHAYAVLRAEDQHRAVSSGHMAHDVRHQLRERQLRRVGDLGECPVREVRPQDAPQMPRRMLTHGEVRPVA